MAFPASPKGGGAAANILDFRPLGSPGLRAQAAAGDGAASAGAALPLQARAGAVFSRCGGSGGGPRRCASRLESDSNSSCGVGRRGRGRRSRRYRAARRRRPARLVACPSRHFRPRCFAWAKYSQGPAKKCAQSVDLRGAGWSHSLRGEEVDASRPGCAISFAPFTIVNLCDALGVKAA